MTELDQFNAIIGLSKRIEGWPSTLAELGYTLDRIELKFSIPDPQRPGVSLTINPDLLFVADQRNFSLLVELKSGTFQGFQQLDRFVALKPLDLIRSAHITLADNSLALKHALSVIQVINDGFLPEYLAEFQRVNHTACLVSLGASSIQAHHSSLADTKADREFKNGIPLSKSYPPTRLLRVLPTTDDEYALIRSVVDAVKFLWINNERVISPLQVAKVEFQSLWDIFDRPAQSRYLQVAKAVLKDMQQTEFHPYIAPIPGGDDQWKLLNLPESVEQKRLTRAQQTLQNAAQEYKYRRQNNQPYHRRHSAQTSLYDIEGVLPRPKKGAEG